MDKHKLILPLSILVGCIILGGFYYKTETNKQASAERQQQADLKEKKAEQQATLQAQQAQQQADLQAKQDEQQATTEQINKVKGQKADCVSQAQETAVNEYKSSSYCSGDYDSYNNYNMGGGQYNSHCYDGTYLVSQYNNAYDVCLQSKGLK